MNHRQMNTGFFLIENVGVSKVADGTQVRIQQNTGEHTFPAHS